MDNSTDMIPGPRKRRTVKSNASGTQTREHILRSAEQVFAEFGLHSATTRQLASAADVPLALIGYHFGSKENLYRACLSSRIEPISDRRRKQLAQLRADGLTDVRSIFEALARPWADVHKEPGGSHYTQLIAREVSDPQEGSRGILAEYIDPVAREFIDAIAKTPGRPDAVSAHSIYLFFIGSLLQLLANTGRAERLAPVSDRKKDLDEMVTELIEFYSRAFDCEERNDLPKKRKR